MEIIKLILIFHAINCFIVIGVGCFYIGCNVGFFLVKVDEVTNSPK